jgi:hypothetical protein
MNLEGKHLQKGKNTFALRLMSSVRRGAEAISTREGVSLNQFINLAVAEKVARLEHAHWAENRKPVTEADRADALELLRRGGRLAPGAGDEIPAEYLALKRRKAVSKVAGAAGANPRNARG